MSKMRSKASVVRSSRDTCSSLPNDGENVPDPFDEDVPINLEACVVCDVLDERVSCCPGTGCFLSFHAECVDADSELAHPYCPYCWFKTLALKSKSLRDDAVVAEKAASEYLDKERQRAVAGDGNGNKEHRVVDVYSSDDEQVLVDKDCGQPRGENILLTEDRGGFAVAAADKVNDEVESSDDQERTVATQNLPGSEDDRRANVNEGARRKRGTSSYLSLQESFPEQNGKNSRRRRLVTDEVESSDHEERVATQNLQGGEDDIRGKVDEGARRKRGVSSYLSAEESFSGEQNGRNIRRRRLVLVDADSELSSNQQSRENNVTDQITSSTQVTSASRQRTRAGSDIVFLKKDLQKRQRWTVEEEETLKLGVETFAAKANKNMPWRKILEWGGEVFDETRTPADLKDKWRNMVKKAQC